MTKKLARNKNYFADIPHYLYQHLSGLELMVYLIIRANNAKPTCNAARLFKKYGINPSSGRKALKRLLDTPVARELSPKKVYLTKVTVPERYKGLQQDLLFGPACTSDQPLLKVNCDHYRYPHDYQNDDSVPTGKVYRKRWYLTSLTAVASKRAKHNLSWASLKIYFVTMSYISLTANSNGCCYASHASIAKRAGMSPSSRDKVCRHLGELVSAGMLVKGYRTNEYGKVTVAYCPNKKSLDAAVAKGLVSRYRCSESELSEKLRRMVAELSESDDAFRFQPIDHIDRWAIGVGVRPTSPGATAA